MKPRAASPTSTSESLDTAIIISLAAAVTPIVVASNTVESLNGYPYFQRGMSLKHDVWVDHPPHGVRYDESQLKTLAQLRAFLQVTLTVEFQAISNDWERYGFISAVLQRFTYRLKYCCSIRAWDKCGIH